MIPVVELWANEGTWTAWPTILYARVIDGHLSPRYPKGTVPDFRADCASAPSQALRLWWRQANDPVRVHANGCRAVGGFLSDDSPRLRQRHQGAPSLHDTVAQWEAIWDYGTPVWLELRWAPA